MSVIPFTKPKATKPKEEACSFCSKPKSRVAKLISSSTGFAICNACVEHATNRLKEENETTV